MVLIELQGFKVVGHSEAVDLVVGAGPAHEYIERKLELSVDLDDANISNADTSFAVFEWQVCWWFRVIQWIALLFAEKLLNIDLARRLRHGSENGRKWVLSVAVVCVKLRSQYFVASK